MKQVKAVITRRFGYFHFCHNNKLNTNLNFLEIIDNKPKPIQKIKRYQAVHKNWKICKRNVENCILQKNEKSKKKHTHTERNGKIVFCAQCNQESAGKEMWREKYQMGLLNFEIRYFHFDCCCSTVCYITFIKSLMHSTSYSICAPQCFEGMHAQYAHWNWYAIKAKIYFIISVKKNTHD